MGVKETERNEEKAHRLWDEANPWFKMVYAYTFHRTNFEINWQFQRFGLALEDYVAWNTVGLHSAWDY